MGDLYKVLVIGPEEIAQSQELTYLTDCGRWLGVLYRLQFVCPRFDSALGESKPEASNVVQFKLAFGQVDLDLM